MHCSPDEEARTSVPKEMRAYQVGMQLLNLEIKFGDFLAKFGDLAGGHSIVLSCSAR